MLGNSRQTEKDKEMSISFKTKAVKAEWFIFKFLSFLL